MANPPNWEHEGLRSLKKIKDWVISPDKEQTIREMFLKADGS